MNRMTLFTVFLALAAAPAMAGESKPKATTSHHGHAEHGTTDHSQHQGKVDEFATLDKNKDGKLTRAELPAKHPMAAHFAMMDANKDGSLSKAEFGAHHGM